jgi:DNA-binding XRE family transcriptional regulator
MKLLEKPMRDLPKGLPEISDRMEYVRCVLGYPVGAFANKIGSAKTSIVNVVMKTTKPHMGMIDNLVRVFPVSQEWLFMGKGSAFTVDDVSAYVHGSSEYDLGPIDDDIAGRVREIRADLGQSQAMFASELGVSKDTITFIELKRSGVSIPLLKRLLKKYSISESWMLWGVGRKYKQRQS